MRISAYYAIRPRPALIERLKDVTEDDNLDVLRGPYLWHNSEGGKSVWHDEDHTHLVKLLFLARLISPYWIDDVRATFRDFLGPPPYHAETFDRWWSIERYAVDQDADDVWKHFDSATLALLDASENPLVASRLVGERQKQELVAVRHGQATLLLPEVALAILTLFAERFPNAPREIALPKEARRKTLEFEPPTRVSFVTLEPQERGLALSMEDDWPAKAGVLQLRFKEFIDLNPERIEIRFEFQYRSIKPGDAPIYDVFVDHTGTAHQEIELEGDNWKLRNRFLRENSVHRWRR